MMKFFSEILLALVVTQFMPVDGEELERRAELPRAGNSSPVFAWNAMKEWSAWSALPTNKDAVSSPVLVEPESLGVVTTAKSVLVVDRDSGTTLFQKQPDQVRAIGSMTKLMTAMLFLEGSPEMSTGAFLTNEDVRDGGRLYFPVNNPVTVQDLFLASLVGSDNSATMALVRLSGMGEGVFVERMNARAEELGMDQTHFVDPTGLSAQNISTAQNIVRLLDAALAIPAIREATIMARATVQPSIGRPIVIPSTDDLLESFLNDSPFHIFGGKTGYLPEAGYGMALGIGHEGTGDIFIIVLGSASKEDRSSEVKGLASWAYRVFAWK
jgi:D-alanyl-D-alanine endopeptidase (penicillin-binding protein 7)